MRKLRIIEHMSLDGVIQSWNAGAQRIFGYTADAAVGRHISLVIPPDRLSEEDKIVASLKAGQRIEHFETERVDRKSTRLNSSHLKLSRMPSSA